MYTFSFRADLPYNSEDTNDDLCWAVLGNMIGNMDADVYKVVMISFCESEDDDDNS